MVPRRLLSYQAIHAYQIVCWRHYFDEVLLLKTAIIVAVVAIVLVDWLWVVVVIQIGVSVVDIKQGLAIPNCQLGNDDNRSQISPWSLRSCQYICLSTPNCLNLLLIVSWRWRTRLSISSISSWLAIDLGHLTKWGASPLYPSSASTLLPSSSSCMIALRKMVISL